MGRKPGTKNKISMIALQDMERLGINPIEMLNNVYRRAIEAFDKHRGDTEKGDAGPSYLAVAGKAAADLAKYKHPTLSAIAIKDISSEEDNDREPMTTEEAMKVILSDPFAPEEIKIPSDQVVEAMNTGIQVPLLPEGKE